jgi:isoleucyl-tRNA synthetase
LHEILNVLVRLMAPVLSFTSEEVWQLMPKQARRLESVHLDEFPPVRADLLDDALEATWEILLSVRDEVLKALETARKAKLIGTSLEAKVEVLCDPELLSLLTKHLTGLPMLFIVSAVDLGSLAPGRSGQRIEVRVGRAEGQKCARCWTFNESVGRSPRYPDVCARCAGVLDEIGYSG